MKKRFLLCAFAAMLFACSSELNVVIKEKIETEYGVELDHAILFDKEKSDENVKVKEVKNFDNKKTGEQEITVIFIDDNEKTKEENMKITVKDTKKPEITWKKESVSITQGDTFDPVSNIKTVKDPIDGDIKKAKDEKATKDGYIIKSDVKTDTAGDYTVTITAYDKNGNKAEKSYKVTVKEKPKEVVSQPQPQTQNTQPVQSQTMQPSQQQSTATNTQPSTQSNQETNQKPAPTPAPEQETKKIICPRTGKEPEDPTKPCDAVIDWEGANPQILFDSFEEANQWGWKQIKDPDPEWEDFIDAHKGYGASNVCTNDGYCDWGIVYFYK